MNISVKWLNESRGGTATGYELVLVWWVLSEMIAVTGKAAAYIGAIYA